MSLTWPEVETEKILNHKLLVAFGVRGHCLGFEAVISERRNIHLRSNQCHVSFVTF